MPCSVFNGEPLRNKNCESAKLFIQYPKSGGIRIVVCAKLTNGGLIPLQTFTGGFRAADKFAITALNAIDNTRPNLTVYNEGGKKQHFPKYLAYAYENCPKVTEIFT